METRIEGTAAEIDALRAIVGLIAQSGERGCAEVGGSLDPSTRECLTRALAALPAGVAADFERLVGRAHGPALLLDQPTHCPACHVRLAAQLESRVRNRSVIFACPRCLHLLYRVQPAQEEPRLARTPERDVLTRSNAL